MLGLRTRHDFVVPLYLPEDKHVVRGIREILEKGGPKNADHTLTHVGTFLKWQDKLNEISQRKEYFPELDEIAEEVPDDIARGSESGSQTQLQDTFLKT